MLGILAVNIAGFAGPTIATDTPNLPTPGGATDQWAFAAVLVLFEGKMRALFTMLFGASMLLFIERMDRGGRNGAALQARRLGWLALFGYLHYVLLWWGDILFVYALCGLVAFALRRLPVHAMVMAALVCFTVWDATTVAADLPSVAAEEAVRVGTASAGQRHLIEQQAARERTQAAWELKQYRSAWPEQVLEKLRDRPQWPLEMTLATWGETLPLMLIGMALYRSGLFAGAWSAARLRRIACAGLGLGGVATLAVLAWVMPRGFSAQAMIAAIDGWLMVPHLAMALGYAALLVLAAPWLLATGIGRRLQAAGRMAFSNYLGTTLVMTALFYGWGLGLVGGVGHAAQIPFVVLGWALMLAWSAPWLKHFRQGPLEWLWRSLTEGRRLAMLRTSP